MYSAVVRLGRREIRLQRSSGLLMRRFDIGDGEDYHDVLARHSLRPCGPRFSVKDDENGDWFSVEVEPVEEEIYSSGFSVSLDLFHKHVVVRVAGKRVPFPDEQTAREAARALTRAAFAHKAWLRGER